MPLRASLLLVAPALLATALSRAADTRLQPPIDRRAWMVPSASTPLKKLKKPRFTREYPTTADYMRVLERFPLYGERGWRANYRGDPNLGFFADPDSAEMGLRAMGNYVFVMSLLATDPAYDPSVTGIDRDTVLSRARTCLAYMTRSHVTGDIPCGDGRRWGNHWQSAWWTAKMALGARLLWKELTPGERRRVERVVVHEADRHLSRRAPSGANRDTKSEENAWDTEVLAAAIGLFPDHEHASAWRAKLIEFSLNSLSAPQDRSDERLVDGKPLKEQVYTENIHRDYTIENHGAYHFCYMACPLHSLSFGYYALAGGAQPVPEAQFHNFVNVWKRIKPTFLDRRFAYIEGKDWPRYAYGLYFVMPALVVLQQRFGDAEARVMEARRFRTFEEEQIANADGSFFGRRFTHNVMMDRWSEYESDCYADLGVCYLLHRMGDARPVTVPDDRMFLERISGVHVSDESGFCSLRTPALFASFSSRTLGGPYPAAFFIPEGRDDLAEWGANNLFGRVEVAGVDNRRTETVNRFADGPGGFTATSTITYRDAGGTPLYTHVASMTTDAAQRTATVESRFVADSDVTVRSVEGLRLLIASDFFNGGRRMWRSDREARAVRFAMDRPAPERETITPLPIGESWVNIDDRLGVIALERRTDAFVLRQSDRRNGPWGSIHFDALDCPLQRVGSTGFKKGDVILDTRFLLVAGNARRTAELARVSAK